MVEADLPTECALSSDMALSDLEVKSNNDGSTKRKCSPNHEVAKAICDLANSCMGSELAKQHLLYMEREDTQRQEERKEQSHKNRFEEWKKIQPNIRTVQHDLMNSSLDDNMQALIEKDMAGLIKQKNLLTEKLGLV